MAADRDTGDAAVGVDSVVDENLSISAAAAAPTTKEPQSHPLDKY